MRATMRFGSAALSLGLASLGLLGCAKRSASNQASATAPPGELSIAACGAVVVAPAGFHAVQTTRDLEQLRLEGPAGATLSVSCLNKNRTGPGKLTWHMQWILDELREQQPFATPSELESPPLDGHAVVARQAKLEGGGQAAFYFTERARAFYWLVYSTSQAASESEARQRDALVRSFRVTDPLADRGPVRWTCSPVSLDSRSLTDARAVFRTQVKGGRPEPAFDGQPAPKPPRGTFERVSVSGPVGRLTAYVTPDPKDKQRHPAVVWAHGGFGGIDSWFWEPAPRQNDQSARAFRDAGIVLAVGSWRAENDNPGDFELYYGEVDDFLALREHVARLPYVDPDRIYLAGHSSGGALVLLAAEKSEAFRAAFSIGGVPIFEPSAIYDRYGGAPFDPKIAEEVRLRSAAPFVRSIRRPTFYFEGRGSTSAGVAQWMADQAAPAGVPFQAFLNLDADHFSIVAPVTELIAKKILADSGPTTSISFTEPEIDALPIAP